MQRTIPAVRREARFTSSDDKFRHSGDPRLTSAVLPGFEVALGDLFRVLGKP